MVAALKVPPAPRLVSYWTTASRDYTGRLPSDLGIRVEWEQGGHVHSACGAFTGESIDWAFGSAVPTHIDDLATDCALDAGETADYPFAGHETFGAMLAAVERMCLVCGASVESAEHLSTEGHCGRCFIAARAF